MLRSDLKKLTLVRIGRHMSVKTVNYIAQGIINSFNGFIIDCKTVLYNNFPNIESMAAFDMANIINDIYPGHMLGITDIAIIDEHGKKLFGAKADNNYSAIVSTKELGPDITGTTGLELLADRALKVSLHELGHNFGLTDHVMYKPAGSGTCVMTKAPEPLVEKIGTVGYVKAFIDYRSTEFCDECRYFMRRTHSFLLTDN